MSDVDPTADTIPFAEAPCDCPGCEKRWSQKVERLGEAWFLCEEHAADAGGDPLPEWMGDEPPCVVS